MNIQRLIIGIIIGGVLSYPIHLWMGNEPQAAELLWYGAIFAVAGLALRLKHEFNQCIEVLGGSIIGVVLTAMIAFHIGPVLALVGSIPVLVAVCGGMMLGVALAQGVRWLFRP